MFCVQPWLGRVGLKRGFPFEAAIFLQFHAEQRVRKTGEVVIVDAGVDERSGETHLPQDKYWFHPSMLTSNLPNVILHCEFHTPHR